MGEERVNLCLPDLTELEMKVGRKTPESLLMGIMKADAEETCRGDVNNCIFKDDLSTKISNLKQEMRCLRSTDVRILRQLLAVHEGIEAVRWLAEERGPSGSQSSSLTGSLSSLVPLDESGRSLSRYRGSWTSPQDWTEEEDLNQEALVTADVSRHKNYVSPDFTGDRHPSLPPTESQHQHCDRGGDSNPVRRALLRSSRISRREENNSSKLGTVKKVEDSKAEIELKDFDNKRPKIDMRVQEENSMLLIYDAQWCWVESQDDVTLL
ncbi:unnamed protein product [Knipowitschia caucasica]